MVAQRNFVMSIIAEMVFFISDNLFLLVFTGIIPGNGLILLLCKTVYFFSTACMCFFWFLYFEHLRDTNFVKERQKVNLSSSVIWLMGILLIANLFGKFLFYVDADGTYHRGPFFLLTYVLSYLYVFITWIRILADMIRKDPKKDMRMLIMLALFPIAPGAAGIIQFLYPRIPVACVAMAITTLVFYLSWIDKLISLDPLTGLNNRKQLILSFDQWKRARSEQEKIYLLLVDANRFKYINDTYGHLQGDNALKIISKALREGCKNSSRRSIIARYGGDEFVVLTATDNEGTNEELKNSINERLAELVESEQVPFELTVSIGIAELDEEDSLKDLIAKADAAMYDDKNSRR